MKEIEARVYGRVQLVMFRDFTKRAARALGLVGTVENRDDGSVIVRAQGREEALKQLVEKLRKGSMLSKVEKVDVTWREPSLEGSKFSIAY